MEIKTKLDNLEKIVKIKSTKGLAEDLINKCSIFNGRKYFSLDELQSYLVFQTFINYFLTKNGKTGSWKSNEISSESITTSSTTVKTFYPEVISLFSGKYDLKFKGTCLKQNSLSFLHGNILSLYITYKLDTW